MADPLILKKQVGFYELCLFEKYGVRAVFTTRKYDMGFEHRAPKDTGGRKNVYPRLDINWRNIVCPSQIHGDQVFIAQKKDRGRGVFKRSSAIADTDALITAQTNVPIAILTADCLPVFILDPDNRCIALVHAGWRGVHQRLISLTIAKMRQRFGLRPDRILVAMGPAIRRCCYEVGKDFEKKFTSGVFKHSGGKLYFDIAGAACQELEGLGVRREQIYDTNICTSCANHEFFSYRREGENAGRSMSAMEIL